MTGILSRMYESILVPSHSFCTCTTFWRGYRLQKTPETARMAFAMGRENRDWLYSTRPPAGSGGGLKWQTWQTFAIPKSRLSCLESGGREGIRTPGLLVANEALSQLSYSPHEQQANF